jgi:hypothetical protein
MTIEEISHNWVWFWFAAQFEPNHQNLSGASQTMGSVWLSFKPKPSKSPTA